MKFRITILGRKVILTKKIRNGIENFVFAENFSIGVQLGEKKDGKVCFSIWPPYHVI